MSEATRNGAPRGGRGLLVLEAIAIAAVALGVRLVALGHTPFIDELNHVLAAQSYIHDGTLLIPGGSEYGRAYLFTRLVALSFRLFGVSLVAARLPAVFVGVGLVVLIFVWVRRNAGRLSGWLAALLLCFYPASIYLSQQSRFYTLHALTLWLGALSVYALGVGSRSRAKTVFYLVVALGGLVLSLHLQILSLVGTAGVTFWALAVIGPKIWRWAGRWRFRRHLAIVAGAAAALAALWLWRDGVFGHLWGRYRNADLWAHGRVGNFRYYFWLIQSQYPVLWGLFPVLAMIAIIRRPKPATFCASVFVIAFLVQSTAAWKAERYLFYAMPAFFCLSAIGVSEAAHRILDGLMAGLSRFPRFPVHGDRARRLGRGALVIGALYAAAVMPALSLAWDMMIVGDHEWQRAELYRGEPDWDAAARVLKPYLDDEAIVVSTSDLKALYSLGRLDYILSRNQIVTRVGEESDEFCVSWKTKREVISEVSSLEKIVADHPAGIVVAESGPWRTVWCVTPEVADWLEKNLRPAGLPPEWGLHAFRWDHRGGAPAEQPRT